MCFNTTIRVPRIRNTWPAFGQKAVIGDAPGRRCLRVRPLRPKEGAEKL